MYVSNIKPNKFVGVLVILSSLYSSISTADDQSHLLQMHQLLAQEKFQEAYQLSVNLLEEHGGDPQFDFLAGRAAYNTEHFQEAAFAFERVLFTEPMHIKARLLLAFSYFKVSNYGAAQVELNRFINNPEGLTDSDISKIRSYLVQIEEFEEKSLTNSGFNIAMGFGYDSNVNSGTSVDSIILPILGEIELFSGSQETEDSLTELSLGYGYQKKLSQKSGFGLQASITHLAHQKADELNRTTFNFLANYYDSYGDMRYGITGYIQPMLLDESFYRAAYGVIANGTWQLNDKWAFTLGLGAAIVNNDVTDAQDLNQYSVSSSFTYLGTHPQVIDLTYGNDDAKEADAEHNGKDYFSLTYRYIYPYSNKLKLTFALNAQDAEYDALHPTFLVVREDETLSASVLADYYLDKEWRLTSLLRYSDKDSNLPIFAFDRSELKITAHHNF